MSSINLLTTNSRVESPFIIIEIAGYTFGNYSKTSQPVVDENGFTKRIIAQYPNFVQSMTVTKVNGTVNTYSISLTYAIQYQDDPNKIDKILSSASNDRTIYITYGDYNSPNYIYKREQALITKVISSVNIKSSTIDYTITAVSSASTLNAGNKTFYGKTAKPSDIIKSLLKDSSSGLTDVFYGMQDMGLVEQYGLIASDDKAVSIKTQTNISTLDYLNYLVNCMASTSDSSSSIKKHKYMICVYDDTYDDITENSYAISLNGPYFRIIKVATSTAETRSLDTYEIDVGYPSSNIVTDFSISDDEAYSILYDYAQKVNMTEYGYRINNSGDFEYIYAPELTNNASYITTEADKTWWSQVTSYPISASITLKGLLRPAILMTYVKLNVYIYGQKHLSSGTYIVTKQQDSISGSGFRTTLNLVRISGDNDV